MPAGITLTPRLIHKEDVSLTTSPTPVTESVNVLTATGSIPFTVTKMDIVFYSSLTIAANDTAAAAAGVAVGQLYVTPSSILQTRMS